MILMVIHPMGTLIVRKMAMRNISTFVDCQYMACNQMIMMASVWCSDQIEHH